MPIAAEERALQLLRERPDPIASLTWLHAELSVRDSAAALGRVELANRLRRRPDAFLVLDNSPVLSAQACPPELRRAYELALGRAGVDTDPVVVLLAPPEQCPFGLEPESNPAGLNAQLHRSIVTLCRNLGTDTGIHDALQRAVLAAREIDRLVGGLEPAALYSSEAR